MGRRLTLRREALAELDAGDLEQVVGAALSGATCPLADCVNTLRSPCTGYTAFDCVTRSPACV
jgi:hypothetical protein